MWFRFRSCRKCCGDLVLDGEDWRCWQCGRYYYPTQPVKDIPAESAVAGQPGLALGKTVAGPRRRWSERDINAVIAATSRSEFRWWYKNRDVIKYLDEGRTVKEIANLINRGQRQIRIIRERLNELRGCWSEMQPAS